MDYAAKIQIGVVPEIHACRSFLLFEVGRISLLELGSA